MPSQRTMRYWRNIGAAVAGVVVLWVIPALLLSDANAFGLAYSTRLVLQTLAATAATTWGAVFAVLIFRQYDEFAQQGSKFAWYWGGLIGTMASAPIFVFIARGGLRLVGLEPMLPPPVLMVAFRSFTLGYGLLICFQLAGFLVARAWWKASKR
jgi:hypothetical protein